MRLLFLFAVLSTPGLACSCLPGNSVCSAVNERVVFVGRVIEGGIDSIRQNPWHTKPGVAKFEVLESFRGITKNVKTVDVQLIGRNGMCASSPYFLGRTYLVALTPHNGVLQDNLCFNSLDLEHIGDELQRLRDYFSGKKAIEVRGFVGVAQEFPNWGSVHPIAGAMVTAVGTQTHSTLTDKEGWFRLSLPSTGLYKMAAVLSPFRSERAPSTEQLIGCDTQAFALTINNSISGKVRDRLGQRVDHAFVGLIDLNWHPKRITNEAWYQTSSTRGPDLTFTFTHVPPGRYLLITNPEGPNKALPNQRTYYPGASSRANAKIIEVKGNGQHLSGLDLTIGETTQFRKVTVSVRFSDGTPMLTAAARITGAPLPSDGIEWKGHSSTYEKGIATLWVPADRNFKLEITDEYRRDMGGPFTFEYPAGTSPIRRSLLIPDSLSQSSKAGSDK